jgi:hypothetical protein
MRFFFRLRPPTIEAIPLEVLHEAAEVQRMFHLLILSAGRPDLYDGPTWRQYAGIDRPLQTGRP